MCLGHFPELPEYTKSALLEGVMRRQSTKRQPSKIKARAWEPSGQRQLYSCVLPLQSNPHKSLARHLDVWERHWRQPSWVFSSNKLLQVSKQCDSESFQTTKWPALLFNEQKSALGVRPSLHWQWREVHHFVWHSSRVKWPICWQIRV